MESTSGSADVLLKLLISNTSIVKHVLCCSLLRTIISIWFSLFDNHNKKLRMEVSALWRLLKDFLHVRLRRLMGYEFYAWQKVKKGLECHMQVHFD